MDSVSKVTGYIFCERIANGANAARDLQYDDEFRFIQWLDDCMDDLL